MALQCRLWAAVSIGCLASLAGCSRSKPVRSSDAIRLGLAAQPTSALAILCAEEGCLGDEQLQAKVLSFSSGKLAMDALLAERVDAITCSDVSLALACFHNPGLVVLANISRVCNEPCVVARKDRGIRVPADLKGKRIATQKESALHFFLDVFLMKHKLRQEDIVIVPCTPDELVDRLAAGTVDAATLREPYVTQASRKLGDSVCTFTERGLFCRSDQLVTTRTFVKAHPNACTALLSALLKSEAALRNSQEAALHTVALKLDVPEQYFLAHWDDFDLHISLDQGLLLQLDDIARWALRSGLVQAGAIPNFRRHVVTEPLRRLAPDCVSIIE